ncbi:uncharacterized protein BKA78DRAFT_139871 [Phyllosticta capitalensis]|uniref:uncharacterized protein n=1 Tax=Phyllosticta capitalensis TaxID=121624 RepID=UPI00312EB942
MLHLPTCCLCTLSPALLAGVPGALLRFPRMSTRTLGLFCPTLAYRWPWKRPRLAGNITDVRPRPCLKHFLYAIRPDCLLLPRAGLVRI